MSLQRSLTFWDVFALALGQIIGSGIMVLVGIAIDFTGYAIPYAFLLSAVLSTVKQLPVAFMGSAMPATGGLYLYCRRVLGPRAGFFYLAVLLITHILIALFAIGFAQYTLAIVPALNAKATALTVLIVFYLVNLVGVKEAAIVQRVMIVVLLCGLSSLVAFGLLDVELRRFTDTSTLLPKGWYGFGLACVVLSFATGGAQFVSELGGEMRRPERDLPLAMLGATGVAAVFYTLVSVVAVGILPLEQTAGKPLTEVARAVLPPGVYVAFVVGAGMFALTTSINSTFAWATKSVLIACEDGWLPKGLAVVNTRFNTPHRLLTCLLVLGAAPVAAGWDLRYIIMLGGGLVFVYDLLPLVAAFLLPHRLPAVFAGAHMPMRAGTLRAVSVAGMAVLLVQGALSFSDIDGTGWLLVATYLMLVVAYIWWRAPAVERAAKVTAAAAP